jgi:hypothetical protein
MVVGHTVQAAPTGASEKVPAAQLAQTRSAVVEKTLRVPAAHELEGVTAAQGA